MARELRAEIKADGRPVTHIAVTVRTRSFFTPSKSGRSLEATTDSADRRGACASRVSALRPHPCAVGFGNGLTLARSLGVL